MQSPIASIQYLTLLQMLEFCRTVKPSLQDYEADGVRIRLLSFPLSHRGLQAWPTLLDDFVAWKKAKLENGAPTE